MRVHVCAVFVRDVRGVFVHMSASLLRLRALWVWCRNGADTTGLTRAGHTSQLGVRVRGCQPDRGVRTVA